MNKSLSKKSDFYQIFKILGWAFYLACSWTWCIGMFLPVILIRDYGTFGWLLFAIPNILGATAIGYILAKPNSSKEIIEKHKIACTIFSMVTILFQIYFLGWLSTVIPNTIIVIASTVLLLIYLFGLTIDKNQLLSAFVIWTLSLICFTFILNILPVEQISIFKSGVLPKSTNALLSFTPVFFFGFLLCPYLDLTFHKARQLNSYSGSKIAFTIGFCFMFLLMLIFTFFYAGPMAEIIQGKVFFLTDGSKLPVKYIYILAFHILIQLGFTIILHAKSILPEIKKSTKLSFLLIILSLISYLLPTITSTKNTFLNLSTNEIIYRSFMAFYALIAPAYVFLFLLPKNKKNVPLNKYNLLILLASIVLALPFYAVSFLAVRWNLEVVVLIGFIIVLCSRLLTRNKNFDL